MMTYKRPHQLPTSVDPFALARRLKTPVWVYDTDNNCIAFANEAACAIWKAENEEDLRARNLAEGMSLSVAKRLRQFQADFSESDAEFSEFWTLYPNGEPVTVKIQYTGYVLPDGRMAMMCEVTGEREEEPETLRSTEALLHTDVMITLYSIEGAPLYMNPAARNALPTNVFGFSDLFCQLGDFLHMQADWEARGASQRVAKMSTSFGTKWFDLSVKRCLDAATGESALLVTAVDVSELKTARDKASYLASRDQLTGCYNRSFMQLQQEKISANTESEGASHALLFLDVDRFKQVNDSFGHEVGDTILRTFALRVQAQIGHTDILARMGGDEFVVLIKDLKDRTSLHELLEAIRSELLKPVDCGSVQLNVTASIGVSIFEGGAKGSWSETMKQADVALYHSKRSGRNRYTVFGKALGAEVLERSWLEVEIKKAIEKKAFALHFQPRLDIRQGKVLSAETLLRWDHPERGFIPPDQFIPVCEEMGVIDELGAFVLKRACRQLGVWHRQGFDIDLSVNVSPKQFQDPDFVSLFEDMAAEIDFPTSRLELEITETSLFGDDAEVSEKVHRINELGFRLALDDFGTGYSNLVHISRFPLKCIKMDKSFVQKLPMTGPLLKLILALANQIGATTVAEGVETYEQLNWLESQGCDQVQGFLFSEAVSGDALANRCFEIERGLRKVA